MAWPLALLLILGSLIILFATGMPVAFCFMLINIVGVFWLMGGEVGLGQLVINIFASVGTYTLLPMPLFILMGDVMFYSGIAPRLIDTVDKFLGRLPGRLGLVSVAAGTIISALTGTSMASVAMLGSVLVPEMEKRGYKKPMILGPILGSGGLAIMVPPSSLAVLLGVIGEISIAKLLIAIIFPGLLMAALYAAYIILRCWLQPSLAPTYEVPPSPLSDKLLSVVRNILPLGLAVFLVIGVMSLGIASPTEAAATGTLGMLVLALFYRGLNWEMVKKSVGSTLRVTIMMLVIVAGATSFGQVLAFSGASRGLVEFSVSLPLAPILIFIVMQIIVLFLGMWMSVVAIMLVTLPLFMPVIHALGFDPVWFAAIYLINIEVGTISPPFGMTLFVMKGVSSPDTTMGDIFRAVLPFIYLDFVAMGLIIAFPAIALWFPSMV